MAVWKFRRCGTRERPSFQCKMCRAIFNGKWRAEIEDWNNNRLIAFFFYFSLFFFSFNIALKRTTEFLHFFLFSCHGYISITWCILIIKLAVTRVPLVNPFKNWLFTIFFCKYKILIMPLTGTVRDTVLYIYHWERASCRAVWLWRNPDALAMLSSRCHIIMYRKAIRKHIGWMGSALILASTFVSGFDASLFLFFMQH